MCAPCLLSNVRSLSGAVGVSSWPLCGLRSGGGSKNFQGQWVQCGRQSHFTVGGWVVTGAGEPWGGGQGHLCRPWRWLGFGEEEEEKEPAPKGRCASARGPCEGPGRGHSLRPVQDRGHLGPRAVRSALGLRPNPDH